MFKVFTKRVHKLKQCTNLKLHDENYTCFDILLVVHKIEGSGGGAYSRGGAYFKFRPIGCAVFRRWRYFERRGRGALIRRFTVYVLVLISKCMVYFTKYQAGVTDRLLVKITVKTSTATLSMLQVGSLF